MTYTRAGKHLLEVNSINTSIKFCSTDRIHLDEVVSYIKFHQTGISFGI